MTQIQNQIDRIIYKLKERAAFEQVRFVREFDTEPVETPIRSITAVVGILQTAREKGYLGGYLSSFVKGERYSSKAEIRVYAPADENGSGLSEIVSEMLGALSEADEEKIITEACASSIEFDPDLNAVFRRIEFEIDFFVSGEVQRDNGI